MEMHSLVGTWRLVAFEVRDDAGQISYPFGRKVASVLTYTADGHMAVQFGRADRPRPAGGDWLAAAPAGSPVARQWQVQQRRRRRSSWTLRPRHSRRQC
jgi:hypothetical protein